MNRLKFGRHNCDVVMYRENMEENCICCLRKQKTEDGKEEVQLCTCFFFFLVSSKEESVGICFCFPHILEAKWDEGRMNMKVKENCANLYKSATRGESFSLRRS